MQIFIITFVLLLLGYPVHARVAEKIGKTYSIIEKDALSEIEEKGKEVDWSKKFDKKSWEKQLKKYKPENLARLPYAKGNRVRLIDMTYTLEMDIPDGNGNILYPKGYSFNPLDYMPFLKVMVILDGTSREHLDWYKASKYSKNDSTVLMFTDGPWSELAEELGRPVFYLTTQAKDRFKLEKVPSIVMQKERMLEVTEVHVKEKHH